MSNNPNLPESRCTHGWRGRPPERGELIVTPCPSCGSQSLFIGTGGHLTCGVVPHGYSRGCPEPGVKQAIEKLKAAAKPTSGPDPWALLEECLELVSHPACVQPERAKRCGLVEKGGVDFCACADLACRIDAALLAGKGTPRGE